MGPLGVFLHQGTRWARTQGRVKRAWGDEDIGDLQYGGPSKKFGGMRGWTEPCVLVVLYTMMSQSEQEDTSSGASLFTPHNLENKCLPPPLDDDSKRGHESSHTNSFKKKSKRQHKACQNLQWRERGRGGGVYWES
jgi:hypothetical protein